MKHHKYVVFGTGRMGRAVAWHLANESSTESVKLVDYDNTSARELGKQLLAAKLGHKIEVAFSESPVGRYNDDINQKSVIRRLINGADVCIATCGYQHYETITEACIDEGVNMLDLGGNRETVEAQKKHHEAAVKAGVTIIPDCGLAPGMIGILGMHAFEEMQHQKCVNIDVSMRVGGLPANPGTIDENPFQYELTWSADGLINEYLIPADELRNGELVQIPALTGCENCIITTPWNPGQKGEFEAFVTGGGSSNLPFILKGKARNVNYKTLRYRGHCNLMRGLARLGFFSEQVIAAPHTLRHVLTETLKANLTSKTGDDVVIARAGARASGKTTGKTASSIYEVFCARRDVFGQSFSAMAQTTGFSAGVIAHMIADHLVKIKGVVDGEIAVPGRQFIERLRKTGIIIQEFHK